MGLQRGRKFVAHKIIFFSSQQSLHKKFYDFKILNDLLLQKIPRKNLTH
jgi:hypothetical protein